MWKDLLKDKVKQEEGLRLETYLDSEKVPTIGYGSIRHLNGNLVQLGEKITENEANQLLNDYLEKNVYNQLERYDLNDNQKISLGSLMYNCGNLSIACPKLNLGLLHKDYTVIYNEWNFGIKNGLFTRRSKELALFFKYPFK